MTAQHFNGFTPLPAYPTPDMPDDTYNSAAYATTEAYPIMIAEMTAAAAVVENNANLSEQQAGVSGAAATAAAKTLIDVQTAANAAYAASNYKGDWVNLSGALNVPATVTHLGRQWYLKLNLANVTTQAPALGSTYWGEVSRNDFTVLPCPAGTTNAADRGLYRMTSSASVLLLPAAPWHGMVVAAANVSGTLTPVISRNGKTICGDAENFTMNVVGFQIVLQYDSLSGDWVRVSGLTAFTAAQPAIGTSNTWTASQGFNAGASFGDGRVIKRKTFSLTSPAGANGRVTTAHGLDATKIISISGVVRSAGIYQVVVPVNNSLAANQTILALVDPSNLHIDTTSNSSDVYSKSVFISIEYEG